MGNWGPFDLEGKIAVVTGGAMGIGHAIASRLVEAGASVVIADYDQEKAEAAAAGLNALMPGRATSVQADIAADGAGAAVVAKAIEAFGRLDIFVNNAGIYPFEPLLDMRVETLDRVLAVNLRGTILASQAAARQMVAQGVGGRIINIASVDGIHPSMVGLAAYDASKGGVVMFTKNLALELAPHGILVNAIAPGGVFTEGVRRMQGLDDAAAEPPASGVNIPLGRMARPDEIATVAVFLAAPASSYMTGDIVVVDGGMLIG